MSKKHYFHMLRGGPGSKIWAKIHGPCKPNEWKIMTRINNGHPKKYNQNLSCQASWVRECDTVLLYLFVNGKEIY